MHTDYFSLYSTYVKNPKKVGSDGEHKGHCPFHDDEKASLSFNENTGLFYCHAGCSKGNAYQFAEKIGMDPSPYKGNGMEEESRTQQSNKSHHVEPLSQEHIDRVDRYHAYFLDNLEMLNVDGWDKTVIELSKTGFDHKSKNFVFPTYDHNGNLINWRCHKGKQEPGIKGSHFFPEQLFKLQKKFNYLTWCEGEPDCLGLLTNGIPAITNTNGAGKVPDDLSPLKDIPEIIIALDNDKAGQVGALRIGEAIALKFPRKTVRIHHWDKAHPEGYDIRDFLKDGGTVEELKQRLKTAARYASKSKTKTVDPLKLNWSDAGNAELLVYLFGDRIRYNHTNGSWYVWNGQFWERDIKHNVKNLAIEAARYRQKLAASVNDPKKKEKMFKFGVQSEGKVRTGFCLDLTKSLIPIATVADEWNNDHNLFQFSNGCLDLDNVDFSRGKPEQMITQTTGYDYDPTATCPTWEKAILEIMAGRKELVLFIQRSVGYSLSGDVSEQCFFILYGVGANGKTVLLAIFRMVLGNYAKDSAFSAFEYRHGNTQSNDLARLNSARLVTSAESGSSKHLNEERLKAITGGDLVTARFLYKEYFSYNPTFKLWLAVNSLPEVKDFSDGFWRRVRLIPFTVQFKGEKADPHLIDKLGKELPGIANWAIRGYQMWRKDGLNPPEEVLRATAEYHQESDMVAEFLDTYTVTNPGSRIRASELYLSFCKWVESEHPHGSLSQTLFGRRVSMVTGIKSEKVGSYKYYFNLELLENDYEISC